MEMPGLGWEVGVGEFGSGAVDVPGLGREVLGESQQLQAGSEIRQLLDHGLHCTVSLARKINLSRFSRDAQGMNLFLVLTDFGMHSILLPVSGITCSSSRPSVSMLFQQQCWVHTLESGQWQEK